MCDELYNGEVEFEHYSNFQIGAKVVDYEY